ncbi:MAG: bifunctional 2-polyprenyl-6-hydroxyphenol methylase/3-demethylubiquinol 3-O-methyltransferase UbiG [Gammaproteobacteria bacterium]|nr:bifunctional 2-polyprenyl-6-hydroxyphenol methylase/3-demethylubiquinol 3-O-methyltransferase UbiG [Gammaproteobacteria bacterium]
MVEQEIEKFALQAAEWWDPHGALRTLHEINPLRLDWIQQHYCLVDSRVLDVGCGGGILSEAMARLGAQVSAIDLASPLIEVAQQHAQAAGLTIDYHCMSVETLAEKQPLQFDVITCMELLEHVDSPLTLLQACSTLLKPGGTLFVSTLNRNFKSWLLAIAAAEYLLAMIPQGTHDYRRFIRPAELDAWAQQADLLLKRLQGFTWMPFSRRFRLCNDIAVNYMAMLVKR